jgi:hypothetical protein
VSPEALSLLASETREAADEIEACEQFARETQYAKGAEIADACRASALASIRRVADALNGAAIVARSKRARGLARKNGGST